MIADHTSWEADGLAVACLLGEGEAGEGWCMVGSGHQLQEGAGVEDDHR